MNFACPLGVPEARLLLADELWQGIPWAAIEPFILKSVQLKSWKGLEKAHIKEEFEHPSSLLQVYNEFNDIMIRGIGPVADIASSYQLAPCHSWN